ncbi:glycosyltransferase family 2 protein [Marinobacter sp. SS21]|uniref:glycosyltransferase family 2 protein n=1 Tax=Marinobacter sp. SS21 TaxID=2979460 RepID=UPI00232BB6CE|nr:glycosyltransferase family 2 protein [Marinobacter sp. SS21]MDC0661784.1 glycosyltransferase family 2 protein [Marinobacter sp. SS21]
MKLSIVLPAKNEAESLKKLLPRLKEVYHDAEVIVVNDGSTDDTSSICKVNNVIEVFHAYSKGNGAAIKAGTRVASGDVIVFMDGDGQHDPEDIKYLLGQLNENYDMVVGSRSFSSQAGIGRAVANYLYCKLATYMSGHKVNDLTSGFRVVRADKFKEFLYLLPNGFSYPTTSTMAFFRAGYSIKYVNVNVSKRVGKSHIRPIKDGAKFFLVIFKIGTLYSPLKIFAPISLSFLLLGFFRYLYTYVNGGQFTNMSALFFSVGVIVLLVGLVSEQITTLIYQMRPEKKLRYDDEKE